MKGRMSGIIARAASLIKGTISPERLVQNGCRVWLEKEE